MTCKRKKGLLTVYNPPNLQQFAWYYFTHGAANKSWDALCFPDYMEPYCKRIGLFDRVIKGNAEYINFGIIQSLFLLIKMVGYFLVGKQKALAKDILGQYVGDVNQYDEIVCLTDTGFINGLCALFADEMAISYLDSGTGDYKPRSKWHGNFKKTSLAYWKGLIINLLGYGSPGRFYFEHTKNCNKYCAIPDKMCYRNYKQVLSFDMSNTDIHGYKSSLAKMYPELCSFNFSEIDAVFFTEPPMGVDGTYKPSYFIDFNAQCSNHVGQHCNALLLKKHPRDKSTYVFPSNVRVVELNQSIPAEIILPYIEGKKIYFTRFSSVIIFMQQYGYDYNIFYSDAFYRSCLIDSKCTFSPLSREQFIDLCEKFSHGHYSLIELNG